MALANVTIHSSQFPENVRRELLRCLRASNVNPKFHYDATLFWNAKDTTEKETLAPGPNNPVGPVWIDLSKEHYGIHGTPEPGKVGHASSHGCIRLTNWDALDLAAMVRPATLKE